MLSVNAISLISDNEDELDISLENALLLQPYYDAIEAFDMEQCAKRQGCSTENHIEHDKHPDE